MPDDTRSQPQPTGEARTTRATKLRIDEVELVVFDVPAPVPPRGLTEAEREVAELVLEGLSNRDIAERRGASVKTIANQLRRIYEKLGVSSRFELAARLEG
jgi:DNA-binding NarL/FixJ family response regulator